MKNFTIGVIVGAILTIITGLLFSQQTDLLPALSLQPEHKNLEQLTLDTSVIKPTPTKPNKIKTPYLEGDRINSKLEEPIQQQSKLRDKFQDLAANIDEKNLGEAIVMLDSILKITPEELFDTEVRDEEIALKRENELEVKFYEKLPYQGQSKITSLECKSTVCKVVLSVPEGTTFSPFPLFKWDSSMKSSRLHKKTKNNEFPSMTVYFGIEGTNLPEDGFDLKYKTNN